MDKLEIKRIAEILIDDEIVVRSRRKFYDAFNLPGTFFVLNKQSEGDYDFFVDVLTHWVSFRGSEANVGKLCGILRELQFNLVVEKLRPTVSHNTKVDSNSFSDNFHLSASPSMVERMKKFELKSPVPAYDIEILRKDESIADELQIKGMYEDALHKYKMLWWKKKSILGQQHEETLLTSYNMALTLYYLERYDEAIELFKSVLVSMKTVLGETHELTMSTKHQIALLLMKEGKNIEAMKMYEEIINWIIAELGDKHPDTLTTKHNIALCFYEQGEYGKARTLFEQVLEMEMQVLGEEHPLTLKSKYMLAWTLQNLGESENVLMMLRQVFILREKVLGPEHPHTIETKNDVDDLISKHPSNNY